MSGEEKQRFWREYKCARLSATVSPHTLFRSGVNFHQPCLVHNTKAYLFAPFLFFVYVRHYRHEFICVCVHSDSQGDLLSELQMTFSHKLLRQRMFSI